MISTVLSLSAIHSRPSLDKKILLLHSIDGISQIQLSDVHKGTNYASCHMLSNRIYIILVLIEELPFALKFVHVVHS